MASTTNPHKNARAELKVKTVKMLLMDIVSAKGILDRAVVSGALLQLRNTLDRDSKLSPAKALYGRELRDFLPRPGTALIGGHVDEPVEYQGDGSDTLGQIFREEVS